MSEFQRYSRKGFSEMRPYVPGEDLSRVSVSPEDDPGTDHGMIARNPNNHDDQWYVARAWFEENYDLLPLSSNAELTSAPSGASGAAPLLDENEVTDR